ncbi:uncharacterized protein TNCV_4920331 [Trichonephila clavipes]|nr:uncharacterized protein TNCV_4920331 [Trichonephila clavipes]
MEAVGATRIFQRSIVKRGIKYAHYYGDGDSDWGGLTGMVAEYKCTGHVQKRVGARMHKLKSKNNNLSGKDKLTESFIDRLQNYYRIVVRINIGNISGIQQNVSGHQMSRKRCMGSVSSEELVGATISEHCLAAKRQNKSIKTYQMKC